MHFTFRQTIPVSLSLICCELLVIGCSSGTPTPAVVLPLEPNRTVSVTGYGVISVPPDIAYIQARLISEASDAAQTALATDVANAIDLGEALSSLGVEAQDIETTRFSSSSEPNYAQPAVVTVNETTPSPSLYATTYRVDHGLNITVRDISKIGDVLGRILEAGTANITSVTFSVSNFSELEAQARQQALVDAQARAEQIAATTSLTLGQPLSITEQSLGETGAIASAFLNQLGTPPSMTSTNIQVSLSITVIYSAK